jgi:hypothetical protein
MVGKSMRSWLSCGVRAKELIKGKVVAKVVDETCPR